MRQSVDGVVEMVRELLFSVTKKDFKVDTFRAGGPGGQKQNKTSSAVRITHIESGAVGECRNHRSQAQNKKEALRRLIKTGKWKVWHSNKVHECISGETLEQKVKKAMHPRNLEVEICKDGKWTKETDEN